MIDLTFEKFYLLVESLQKSVQYSIYYVKLLLVFFLDLAFEHLYSLSRRATSIAHVSRVKFLKKASSRLNLFCKITRELTFENFYSLSRRATSRLASIESQQSTPSYILYVKSSSAHDSFVKSEQKNHHRKDFCEVLLANENSHPSAHAQSNSMQNHSILRVNSFFPSFSSSKFSTELTF